MFSFVAASSDQSTVSTATLDEARTAEPDAATVNLISQPSASEVQYADTLLQISPLFKAVAVPGARKRKATGSKIITSSPYKNALKQKQQEKKRPAKTKQEVKKSKSKKTRSRKKQLSMKKCTAPVNKKKVSTPTTALEETVDNVVQPAAPDEMSDQSKKQNVRPTRVRRQCFSLAETVRAI